MYHLVFKGGPQHDSKHTLHEHETTSGCVRFRTLNDNTLFSIMEIGIKPEQCIARQTNRIERVCSCLCVCVCVCVCVSFYVCAHVWGCVCVCVGGGVCGGCVCGGGCVMVLWFCVCCGCGGGVCVCGCVCVGVLCSCVCVCVCVCVVPVCV